MATHSIDIVNDIIFREEVLPVIEGYTTVGDALEISAPVMVRQHTGLLDVGITIQNKNEDNVALFSLDGRLHLSGLLLAHSEVNPLLPSIEGLRFFNAEDSIVACIDFEGNLHTVAPVVTNLNLVPEFADIGNELAQAEIVYTGTSLFSVKGNESTLPILQVVDRDDNCLLKINQTGLIETTTVVVPSSIVSGVYDTVYGSYRF